MQYVFQLTRPSRGVTVSLRGERVIFHISTHTPLAGRDLRKLQYSRILLFQLTRPSRGVTEGNGGQQAAGGFQLTRPSRGVTKNRIKGAGDGGFQLTRPSRGVT